MFTIFKTRIPLFVALLIILISSSLNAEPIGKLTMDNGTQYIIQNFGGEKFKKYYYVKNSDRYFSIEKLKKITRKLSTNNAISYLITLKDGTVFNGRAGFIFYEKKYYRGSHTGLVKTAYIPVLKDRGQDGLIFTSKDFLSLAQKTIEIANPNSIDNLILHEKKLPASIASNLNYQTHHN